MGINNVIFKGTAEGIQVVLNRGVPFEVLMEEFKHKLKLNEKFFKGVPIQLSFKGRELTEEEEKILLDILSLQEGLEVSYVDVSGKDRGFLNGSKKQLLTIEETQGITRCRFYTGTIRSGSKLEFDGTLILLGDVNPGAIIESTGNIIVLGSLNGIAYAGKNKNAPVNFIVALNMNPSQIGIKGSIAQPSMSNNKKGLGICNPHIAYIKEERIYVDEIDVGTIHHMVEGLINPFG